MENSGSAKKWLRDEWKQVYIRRQRAFGCADDRLVDRDPVADSNLPEPEDLVGVSVSGGGIRSALYNDGFLQGLSHRGFLRYVDYISSVSGGGYIAGHLTAQASYNAKHCFHDDEERRKMGRDPDTGEVEPERLAGIGGYLSRSLEFLPAYLWSFFFTFAFYFGAVGILATLAALFWRSFDDPFFRGLYRSMMGPIGGSEFLIAFIPAILVGLLGVLLEIALSAVLLVVGFEARRLRDLHIFVRKVSLLSFVLAFLTSIAIFLGNGFSTIHGGGGAGERLYLNNYAQWFVMIAGTIQILVFLGRDRLFKSELGQAKPWQRYLQQSVTTVVLLFLIFSMVHWMGRENISGYADHRDPHFVQGDVSRANWVAMNELFRLVDPEIPRINDQGMPLKPLLSTEFEEKIEPKSSWVKALAPSRLGLGGIDTIQIESDLSTPQPYDKKASDAVEGATDAAAVTKEDYDAIWTLRRRLLGASFAYYLAMTHREESGQRNGGSVPIADEIETVAGDNANPELDASASTFAVVQDAFDQTWTEMEEHENQLKKWNELLGKEELTLFLLEGVLRDNEKWKELIKRDEAKSNADTPATTTDTDAIANGGFNDVAPLKSASTLFDTTTAKISSGRKKTAINAIRRLVLEEPAFVDGLDTADDQASVNRILLEAIFPSAIKQANIPSTMVVPPHDQRTRKRWLGFWMCVMLLGMLGSLGPHRVATVFNFYKQQLGSNFLVAPKEGPENTGGGPSSGQPNGSPKPTKQWSRNSANKELHELNPTHDGLPYPLLLAASLEPATRNGSYHVEARPFVFSPIYCGRFGNEDFPIPSKQVSFRLNPLVPSVTLADAVTLSGAAVTPLMTSNRWLSIILDFFNTGIGQRLRRVDRTDYRLKRYSLLPVVIALFACLIALLTTIYVLELGWAMTGLSVLTTLMLSYCVIGRVGSPGLIRSLVAPHKTQSERGVDWERSFYVADGGYCDYLGVSELLRRRCELIVVSDAGANVGSDPLGTLARMCKSASHESGIRFLDLDHEAPIDFGRLEATDQRLVHQPYLCMRIRYPEPERKEGLLFYCQMSITENDPIEIKHIRNLFPSFPDEPTVNQFYTEQQVAAYRSLGYHIANRLCHELQNWKLRDEPAEGVGGRISQGDADQSTDQPPSEDDEPQDEAFASRIPKARQFKEALLRGHQIARITEETGTRQRGQPLFTILRSRMLVGYRLACYQEHSYRRDDIFSEAIWPTPDFEFPTFTTAVNDTPLAGDGDLKSAKQWLLQYERSADVRSAYRTAVINDINALDIGNECFSATLYSAIIEQKKLPEWRPNRDILAAHLTNIATACQEVHRGRPHAAFQVGGREKLIHLCVSVADVICNTFDAQTEIRADHDLLADMDGVIAELIEMQGSVFQGGEHVTTISFAQCVSAMWGRIMRGDTKKPKRNTIKAMCHAFLGPATDTTSDKSSAKKSPELRVVELRSNLDLGLNKMRLDLVGKSLAKSWFLGYFTTNEIRRQLRLERKRRESKLASAVGAPVDSIDTGSEPPETTGGSSKPR